ncbi:hypothetical protein A2U01_0074169, partial [Trifolium medium]|nr:hypothetical protein [Trifolium medium]
MAPAKKGKAKAEPKET